MPEIFPLFHHFSQPYPKILLSTMPRERISESSFFILNPNQSIREVQPLQAFVSCAVNVNNEQLPHKRFDQISDHKCDIYVYGKVITKLLAQAANKNTKFMFSKTGRLLFS